MSHPDGSIVWLASFPKSGNTWFRVFLANILAGETRPRDINELGLNGGIASNRDEFEAFTMLDSGLLSHEEIDLLRPKVYEAIAAQEKTPRWIKVHDAYTYTEPGQPLLGYSRAAVYLIRDPRDVVVSLAHHNTSTFEQAMNLVNNPESALADSAGGQARQLRQRLGGWAGHVTSWTAQSDVPVHLIRYEDLLEEPVERFDAALRFLGLKRCRAEIERAVTNSDFQELEKQEREQGFRERVSHTNRFFRSGRAGDWESLLTSSQVAAIEESNGAVMSRFGYRLVSLNGAGTREKLL